MAAHIKLVCINIERSKHLSRVIPFLQAQEPEVLCVQELCEKDIPLLRQTLGMTCLFAPSGVHPTDDPNIPDPLVGVGIFSSLPIVAQSISYYSGSEVQARTAPTHPTFTDNAVVSVDVQKGERVFRIMTTHFSWTPDGSADEVQRRNIVTLLSMLAASGELVLCGDFNAPRIYKGAPGEIFSQLSLAYRDAIPAHYVTSIDASLHRNDATAAHELADKMVDGLFLSPSYSAEDVELHGGISDHFAITATIACT